jgi:hypothetical protein
MHGPQIVKEIWTKTLCFTDQWKQVENSDAKLEILLDFVHYGKSSLS